MSTELVAAEIRRFLASGEPEVLCIKGKWGVGKTFAWLTYLAEVQQKGALGVERYAYVSLFGHNSLDDLRYAIVESTVTAEQALSGPNVGTFRSLLNKGFDRARKIGPTAAPIAAALGLKDAADSFAKSAFLLVRKQLICLDDLERAGDGLKQRDVLGLASSLKEQRNCKIVLLLNDEEMAADEREEFERQLEKVADVSLVFDPSPSEAATIALPASDQANDLLRARVTQLGIVNIRVIKKIERLAKRLGEILKDCSVPVHDQAIAAVVLGAWSVLQPGKAPTLEFLKSYNDIIMREERESPEQGDNVEAQWKAHLRDYPFVYADDLDRLIFDGVQRGFFDAGAVLDAVKAVEASLTADPLNNSFSKAWDLYHDSLTVDDDTVLDAMFAGAMENLNSISPVSINSAIKLFREMGRELQANEMLAAYVEAHADNRDFFDLSEYMFMADDEIDPALQQAFVDRYSAFVDERDPKEVLIKIAAFRSWNDADVALLARQTPDELVALFESIEGRDLGRAIRHALRLGRLPDEDGQQLGSNLEEALKRIAAKSPLRARRMRQYGIGA
jgi:hypothetical protein